jgi:cbb3-type cytochrome oxidase maturation protein
MGTRREQPVAGTTIFDGEEACKRYALVAVAALFWAVNSGQYDDVENASRTVLEPDEVPGPD